MTHSNYDHDITCGSDVDGPRADRNCEILSRVYGTLLPLVKIFVPLRLISHSLIFLSCFDFAAFLILQPSINKPFKFWCFQFFQKTRHSFPQHFRPQLIQFISFLSCFFSFFFHIYEQSSPPKYSSSMLFLHSKSNYTNAHEI